MVTELGLDMFGEREDNLFTEMDRRAGFPCTKHVLEGYGVAAALDLQHDAWGDIQRALAANLLGRWAKKPGVALRCAKHCKLLSFCASRGEQVLGWHWVTGWLGHDAKKKHKN
eukprot:EG_transcript_33607